MDERLRERIADIIVEREDESPLDRADAILQIPEIKEALDGIKCVVCGKPMRRSEAQCDTCSLDYCRED